jgi:pimeloyl-ACP methyl ester carboxylesterase
MDDGMTVRDATLTLDGLRFHYRDWGYPKAPALVLLHAYTQHARTWDTWDTVARALADRFRVLALDQRGHGESDRATDYHEQQLINDFAAFVYALGLARFSAVGFSIGGNAACAYAALYPDRVERLVLVECFTEGSEPDAVAHLRVLQTLPETFDARQDAAAAFWPLAPFAPEEEMHRWMVGGLAGTPDGHFSWRSDPVLRHPDQDGWWRRWSSSGSDWRRCGVPRSCSWEQPPGCPSRSPKRRGTRPCAPLRSRTRATGCHWTIRPGFSA